MVLTDGNPSAENQALSKPVNLTAINYQSFIQKDHTNPNIMAAADQKGQ